MDGQSIAAWRWRAVQELSAAQESGDTHTAARLVKDLRDVHVSLGRRLVGTREEQNAYILARHTRTPLPELAVVGINTNDWPAPPNPPALAQPQTASPDTERRISSLFRAVGPLSDRKEPPARFVIEYRPQDNERYHGRLLPYALVDSRTGLPVTYFEEKDWAEYQADKASTRFAEAGDGR